MLDSGWVACTRARIALPKYQFDHNEVSSQTGDADYAQQRRVMNQERRENLKESRGR
jgi:hypothetical protein